MKMIRNTLLVATPLFLTLLGDAPKDAPLGFQLVSDAQAVLGVRRRAVRRGVVVGSSMAAADAAASSAASASAAAAAAPPPAPAPAPAPAATGKPLPLGTVVSSLPGGCTSTPVDGVEYQYCGGNFYRSAFQGNKLVYVTAKP